MGRLSQGLGWGGVWGADKGRRESGGQAFSSMLVLAFRSQGLLLNYHAKWQPAEGVVRSLYFETILWGTTL